MAYREKKGKAWVIGVDMGYGHQRTAYPLRTLAPGGKVINANSYQGIFKKDRKTWENSRVFYEFVSRIKRIPLVGGFIFGIYNEFQKIAKFYPRRDLSEPNISLRWIYFLVRRGWGRHLVKKLKRKPLPLITTFFIPAFMAEVHGYEGEIFCVICDADISRTWASLNPQQSKIKYFAPNQRVVDRLKLYGVKKENIFFTGYPLPKENLGTEKLELLKNDVAHRILNLDPKSRYRYRYNSLIKEYIGSLPQKPNHPLTLMFAVGGAGAQKEIGAKILKSLAEKIKERKIKLILVAGIRKEVKNYFLETIKNLALKKFFNNRWIEIIFERNIQDYFKKFNQALRKTDILWTKPSELSFYTALGLPIIIAPPIGSQEDFNRKWLLELGSAIPQKNPNYTSEWLFDLLEAGWFAEGAMQGFIEADKLGTFNIEKVVSHKARIWEIR